MIPLCSRLNFGVVFPKVFHFTPRKFCTRTIVMSSKSEGPLIGALDQGTTSTRFIVFNGEGLVVASAQRALNQIYPQEGWIEHDPLAILDTVQYCIDHACQKLQKLGYEPRRDIKAVGVTNQRETTLFWDIVTGKPLHNALVWNDKRTTETVRALQARCPNGDKYHFQAKCGLSIETYFSAVKARWLLDHTDSSIQEARKNKHIRMSTIDTWLIWNLTGGLQNGVFVTDVTNASRTMLMNIHTLQWDNELLEFFGIERFMLPQIRSSSEIYGNIAEGPLAGVPIAGCAGDQQAALIGHRCFNHGDAKNTYGTGCFLLLNTGETPYVSKHGLISTVAYQLGPHAKPIYALEGSVAIAGAAVTWLKDKLGIIQSDEEIDTLASQVTSTGGVCFVPAFSGFFAPRWRDEARGVIVGLTQYADKRHICRATLEGVCFQTKEVIDAMRKDSGFTLDHLKVDGGLTKSDTCMQLQADILNIRVDRPDMTEMTSLGAATLAGLAVGVWTSPEQLTRQKMHSFHSNLGEDDRVQRFNAWETAVQCSLAIADIKSNKSSS